MLCFSPVRSILPRIWYLVSPIRSRDVCHALCIRSLTFEKSWRRSEQNTRSRSRYFEMGSGERGLRMHCKPLLPPFPFPMQKTSYSYPKQFDAVLLQKGLPTARNALKVVPGEKRLHMPWKPLSFPSLFPLLNKTKAYSNIKYYLLLIVFLHTVFAVLL